MKRVLQVLFIICVLGCLGWFAASRPVRTTSEQLLSPAPELSFVSSDKDISEAPTRAPARHSTSGGGGVTNLLAQLMNGDGPKLSPAELEPFLEASHRSAESLLGAFRATGDRAFLREAMEKAPTDPRVAFAAYHFATPYKYDEPATPERRGWLDKLKEADPMNPLGDFLSARDYFKAGQPDKAIADLTTALSKPGYQDYSVAFIQDNEEAYRAGGISEAEAKIIACSELPLPHLAELKKLSQNLVDLANTYRQAGDEVSAQAALTLGMNVSERLRANGNQFLIQDLVGIAAERIVLGGMDSTAIYGDSGQTVKDRLDQTLREREEIKARAKQVEAIVSQMSEQDLANYFDRIKVLGETSASRWVLSKYGQSGN
jgi:hypothetical protein